MTSEENPLDVLVLGAGPAGLALGRELARRSMSYLILEKDECVGSTFAKMTDSTTYGPWLNNTLPGSPVPWHRLLSRTTRPDYARYLQQYAVDHHLRVMTHCLVTRVEKVGNEFRVTCATGECYTARALVNATGYFNKPNFPHYPGECRIPSLHSRDYRYPGTVAGLAGRERAKVLIVGSRLSAGEIMLELHDAGHEVHLSHRDPIDTWPSPLQETLLSPFSYFWEEVSLRFSLGRPSNLRPRLRRGRQYNLLTSGKVRTHPEIASWKNGSVRFIDGSEDRFDVILFATGYLAAVDHLAPLLESPPEVKELESVDVANLFFLGLIGGRTFRSEFLRGIREDALLLAERLERRLRREAGPPARSPKASHHLVADTAASSRPLTGQATGKSHGRGDSLA